MNIKRRDFFKGCAAGCVLLLPGMASAAKGWSASSMPVAKTDPYIEKSIKASFGGGFSVQSRARSNGLTYADIEHFETRYRVASANLLDWKIVSPL